MALVERVRESAARGARESLEALAATVPVPIASIAIRVCPQLPPTTEERIADTRAANVADSVMYREALATAAEARGWSVHWYDRERVFRDAAAALGGEDIDASGAGTPVEGLRIAVDAGGCAGFKYQMGLVAEINPDDAIVERDGVKVFVDRDSIPYIAGTTVDFVIGLQNSGFTFDNPQAKSSCSCGKSFG